MGPGDGAQLRERLASHQPIFGLTVRTPTLSLQMPTDPELLELLSVIDGGIHDPSWMPFTIGWTDRPQPERDRESLAHWWRTRAAFTTDQWTWTGAVRTAEGLVGVQDLMSKEFATLREVTSGSWLGSRHQGRGVGREMRAAVLHLAFEGLGAHRAHSSYLEENEASRRVSASLGYEPNGYEFVTVRGTPHRSCKMVLERAAWEARRRDDITIEGLEDCLELFGAR